MARTSSKHRLTGEERNFFTLVNRAVFTNPFSEEREQLDRLIGGSPEGTGQAGLLERSIHEIVKRIERMEKEGRANIRLYSGEDRMLVENSFLYDFFHRFLDRFDRHIVDQVENGSPPLKVPFAGEAFSFLHKRGFPRMEIKRDFEVVFQLRRAFFFIDHSLVGCSSGMRELRRKLWNNVFTCDLDLYNRYLWDRMEDFSTIILGETGSGKGTAAAAIGRSGFIPFDEKQECFVESFTESFVALNLSQFPENLIESELFGHKKGAFTGAVTDYTGIFDRCSPHGAIFLDEIGEVSIPLQIKLLQVLQERVFSPVGSHEQHRFKGRVIAATNRPIEQFRQDGSMRDDFYYRLCSDVIRVPPLRERIQEDSGELTDLLVHTVERTLGRASPDIVEMVIRVIDRRLGSHYPWPGNVRELEQCVRRVLLNRNYEGDTPPSRPGLEDVLAEGVRTGSIPVQALVSGYCRMVYERSGTYEETARRVGLDRRTVKKYVDGWEDPPENGRYVLWTDLK